MRAVSGSLLVVFLTIFIDIMGIGIVLPVLPKLVEELMGGELPQAAVVYGGLLALYAAMQFVFGPVIGALSDRFGRRPVILLALAGLGIDYVLLSLAPSIGWLVVGRLVAGIFGASYSAASAYIADISPPEKRAQSFGLIGAAFGLGFIAGPLIGGLLGELGPRVPFMAAAALSLANLVLGFFLLPESLKPENRRAFTLRHANPFGAIQAVLRYPVVSGLALMFLLSAIAQRALESTWVLFTGYRFAWGPGEVGLSLAVVGLLSALVQGGLLRIVVPKLGERRMILVGLVTGAVSLVLYAFATQAWMMYAITAVYVLGIGFTGPAIQSLVTRAVPANEQGLLQGALVSLMTVTGIVAPPLATGLFGYFIGPNAPFVFPGVAFMLGAVLFAVALGLMLRAAPATGTPARLAEHGS